MPGGDITIDVRQLTLRDGANLSSNAFEEGKAGNVTVNASESVKVIDGLIEFGFPSSISASTSGTGDGGDILINTDFFLLQNGGQVDTITSSGGDAGNLTVNASEVEVIGGQFGSALSTQTQGIGKAGNLSITTGKLLVQDGGQVRAATFGDGNGGSLTVNASEVQVISGQFNSGLSTQTQGTGKAGNLSITTGKLLIQDGGFVSAATFDDGDGGTLSVNATESVQVIGRSANGQSPSGLFVTASSESIGNAGDLSITTRELLVEDGGRVSANTRGKGNGGTLSVDATDSVQVIGRTVDGQFASALLTQTEGIGNARELKITTGELIVKDGAFVSAGTFGEGNGGNLTVDASSTVQVIGTSADGQFASGLFTQAQGAGNAGEFLNITTDKLIISDGAVVSARTFGQGEGGDVSITTGQLMVSNGAQVSAGTFGEGNGGNLTVDASESVQLIGTGTSADGEFGSGLFIQANQDATGNAGEFLNITTDKLIISDGAIVSARSFEPGTSAGEVKINANSIFLDNNSRITAETAGGDKSNIRLEAGDIRLLNRSLILTNAENTDGGNIFIDTDTLVGLGNSDITANALEAEGDNVTIGEGGRVEINAQGIFGLEFRDRPTPDNDITSTSDRGSSFNGEVILNITQVDPTSGLNELPGILVDAEAILANDLCGFENDRIAGGSSFTITGKGGLPPTAEDPVINAHRTVRWLSRPGLASSRQGLQKQPNVRRPLQDKKVIIEAQGWVIAKDGTIILTAHPFRGTPVEQIFPNLDCHSGRGSREQGVGSREE